MSVFSVIVLAVTAFRATEAFIQLKQGDFDTSQRSRAHSYYSNGKPYEKPHLHADEYACLSVGEKRCVLPSGTTCLLTYATENAHCDIMYNGSPDVFLSAKKGNCGARCYYDMLPLVSGDFSTSQRSAAHSQGKNMEKALFHTDAYHCLTVGTKMCMLPSFSTCFLTYHTEGAHCDILYNESKDVMLSAKTGNCRARCFDWQDRFFKWALPLIKGAGRINTYGRSPAHSGAGFEKALTRDDGMYQCLTVGVKKCLVPSYSTCFLAYQTEKAHCHILYNGSKDAYISAKTGNCGFRCYDLNMANRWGRGEVAPELEEEVGISRAAVLLAVGAGILVAGGAALAVRKRLGKGAEEEVGLLEGTTTA